jgi:hypothetical protein
MMNNIKTMKSYYAGGTLCIDLKHGEDTQVLCINLDGTICDFITGESRNMTDWNTDLAFEIYKDVRGETEYYRESLAQNYARKTDG